MNNPQQQGPQPSQVPMTQTSLLEAMMKFANMGFDRKAVAYLEPYKAQVRAAAVKGDGEALANYAVRGVLGMLKAAGYAGHLTPATLVRLIDDRGWDQIHDAIAGDRNALALITRFLGDLQPMSSAPAPAQGSQGPRPSDDRYERAASQPPPQRHQQGQGRDYGNDRGHRGDDAPTPPQRHAQGAERGYGNDRGPGPRRDDAPQGRDHHPLDGPDPRRAPEAHRGHAGPVRRHNEDNVRSIASHPAHAGRDGGHAPTEEERRQGQKKVYGAKSALTLEVDNRKNGAPTLRLEAAKILDAAAKTYDWKNKIVIQLTTSELQKITALLLGLIKQAKFSNHGPKNDKWFEFAHQEDPKYAGTIKVAVGEANEMCILSITHEDIGDVTALFLRQCALAGGLEQSAVPAMLRPVAQAYNLAMERQANRGGGGQRRQG